MRKVLTAALSLGMLAGAMPVASAQLATRTWVSGLGNDANPCTRTAPCLTFAGAIAKTAAGGEINALDAGSYGDIVINKSITIDGKGVMAGIMVTGSVPGVFVNAGNDDVAVLRNLEIQGAGTGSVGIRFFNGKQLIIENTTIAGLTGVGVLVLAMTTGAAGNVMIRNSTISGWAGGAPDGIRTIFGITTVSHSVITGARFGLIAVNSGVINADSNVLTYNGVAVKAGDGAAGQAAATVRLSNNDVYGNLTGFGCGGGVLASAGNNRKGSNTGGTVPACSPNAAITQQ